MDSFKKRMRSWNSLSVTTDGAIGGFMTLWHTIKEIVEKVAKGGRWISYKVKSFSSNLCILLTNVYGLHSCTKKNEDLARN